MIPLLWSVSSGIEPQHRATGAAHLLNPKSRRLRGRPAHRIRHQDQVCQKPAARCRHRNSRDMRRG